MEQLCSEAKVVRICFFVICCLFVFLAIQNLAQILTCAEFCTFSKTNAPGKAKIRHLKNIRCKETQNCLVHYISINLLRG